MPSKLAAFKIFRRKATVAIFSNRNLDFVDLLTLPNDPAKAKDTLTRFVGWTVENLHPEISAIGFDEDDEPVQAAMLSKFAENLLLDRGIPVWKVADNDLLKAYGTPALTQKHDLRVIANSIWPDVVRKLPALDAALVGLFVQTERLLSNH